ncbi:MAG: Uma2 family endonuclease [Planctomycetes bacterium]|nr:Uma2 family endonuclease [Planctomycetota bacterium]
MALASTFNLGTLGAATLPIRFTVEQYHRMIQTGVLREDQRVELLEGWIVPKMPHNPTHDSAIDLLVGEMSPFLPADWFLRVQSAITMVDSEPEPDIAAVRGPRGRYSTTHPTAADIGMLVEVADTSLANDRNVKGPLFAVARIPYYWIVNLPERRVEFHSEPSGPDSAPGYRQVRVYTPDQAIPLFLDGTELGRIEVARILP